MKYTEKEKEALRRIIGGADIYDYALAKQLRQLEQSHPDSLDIGKAMMYDGDGTDQVPYFGAICTDVQGVNS